MRTGILWAGAFLVLSVVGVGAIVTINPAEGTDLFLDKYHAVEAWTGDPYQTQRELGTKYGFWPDAPKAMAPRTPAASLLLTPTVVIPDAALRWVGVVAVPLFALAAFAYAGRIARLPDRWVAASAAVYVAAQPGEFVWVNMTQVTTPLIVAAWWYRPRCARLAGILLGVAAAVKIWPVFVVAVWLCRAESRRAGWWAVLGGGGMTVMGLLLPGVSVAGAVSALLDAGRFFGSSPDLVNVSGLHQFGWPALLLTGALVVVAVRIRSAVWGTGAAVGSGLIAAPVVWPQYWMAALPIAFLLAHKAWPELRPRVHSGGEPQTAG